MTTPRLPALQNFLIVLSLLFLHGCSAGSGGGGSDRQVATDSTQVNAGFVYDGPPPANEDVQNFKRNFYDALAGNDRCGECHTPGGSGPRHFVDQSNVNTAFQEARAVVNLDDPSASLVVQRVAGGHNCWLAANQNATCATTMTGYIERWAAGTVQSSATVKLTPRRALSPSATRVMPGQLTDVDALGLDLTASGELLGLLNTYCGECHSDTASVPQVPFFASANTTVSYAALRSKIDLVDPWMSRLVQRLDPESHNCWSDCTDDAATIAAAVDRLAVLIPQTEVDPALLTSMAQVLASDGIVATAGGRFESGLIAKWEFREGSGTTTADTSGVLPEIPLTLSGQYSWIGGWGVRFVDGRAQGGVGGSSKLFNKITAAGEYSLEAWVAPANVAQEEAWIAAYAGGPDSRNLLLSQSLYNYEAFNRSTATEGGTGGEPALVTADAAERAQATLQHVVLTYDPVDGRRLYVNGEDTGDTDPSGGGLLNNWNESFALVLGNSTDNSHPWAGAMRMVAVYNTALSPEQVLQNYEVGVGQKYFLLFSISELLDQPGVCHVMAEGQRTNYCYVAFEVSQFDDSSYLFNQPFLVNLNPDGGALDFDLRGMRLGVNGKLIDSGQAFVNVQRQVAGVVGPEGLPLASIGTIVPLENGADQDSFFLAFDAFDGRSGVVNDGVRVPFTLLLNGAPSADVAARTFDAINASMSALTGVAVSNPTVSAVTGKTVAQTFQTVRRALPAVADFQAFMSSHQMAATQLAAAYCDALVQDTTLRAALFSGPPAFDFSQPVASPSIDWRAQVVAPLVDRAFNRGLLTSSDRNRVLDEVTLLITDNRDLKPYVRVNGNWVSDPDPAAHNKRDGLIYCANDAPCPISRTADVVKAACTAVFGSAAVLLQ